jgi:aminoglycoside 6'-N-acetyltransferase
MCRGVGLETPTGAEKTEKREVNSGISTSWGCSMRFSRLKTERLTVRRLRPEDARGMAGYRSLSEVAKFQSAYTLAKAEALVEEMAKADPSETGRWFQFAIELTAEGILIGDIGFLNSDEGQKSWIGFSLDPRFWRQGYAAEAVRAVLAYYFELGIASVWASTDPQNEPSMALLRKLGFSLVESKPNDRMFSRPARRNGPG